MAQNTSLDFLKKNFSQECLRMGSLHNSTTFPGAGTILGLSLETCTRSAKSRGFKELQGHQGKGKETFPEKTPVQLAPSHTSALRHLTGWDFETLVFLHWLPSWWIWLKPWVGECQQGLGLPESKDPGRRLPGSLSLLKNTFPSRRLIKIKCIQTPRNQFNKSSICFKFALYPLAKNKTTLTSRPAFALKVKGVGGSSPSPRLWPPCIQMSCSCLNKLSASLIDINTTFATLQYCANLRVILIQCKYDSSCMEVRKYWYIIRLLTVQQGLVWERYFLPSLFKDGFNLALEGLALG